MDQKRLIISTLLEKLTKKQFNFIFQSNFKKRRGYVPYRDLSARELRLIQHYSEIIPEEHNQRRRIARYILPLI